MVKRRVKPLRHYGVGIGRGRRSRHLLSSVRRLLVLKATQPAGGCRALGRAPPAPDPGTVTLKLLSTKLHSRSVFAPILESTGGSSPPGRAALFRDLIAVSCIAGSPKDRAAKASVIDGSTASPSNGAFVRVTAK